MGRITIQEVAKVLTEKNNLDQRAANNFATELFAIIQERLQQGETVKVKGLGTFKIIDVEARESVSVRTGERVVIDGHSKVSFVPDTTMKELVNRPFSQFETVVLNDGIDFEDMKEETTEAAADDEDVSVAEESENHELGNHGDGNHVIPEPAEEQPAAEEEQPVEEQPVEEQPAAEEEQPAAEEEQPAAEEEPLPLLELAEPEEKPWGRWLLMALAVVALMAASAFGGYYFRGLQQTQMLAADTIIVTDTVFMSDTLAAVAEETEAPSKAQTSQKVEAPQKAEAPKKVETPAPDIHDQYAAKDARVRLGAYRIVGTQEEVTVQAGQTFYGICRAYLGPDMECYVEVYNDLPPNAQVKAGQKIKIPKLQLKKRKH